MVCFNGAANKTLAELTLYAFVYVGYVLASMGPQTKRLRNMIGDSMSLSKPTSFNGAANKTLAESGVDAYGEDTAYELQWGRKQNACGITLYEEGLYLIFVLQWGRKQNACGI